MRALRYLASSIVWGTLTSGCLLLFPGLTWEDVWLLLFLFFAGLVEAGLLWSFAAQAESHAQAIKAGTLLGLLMPIICGLLLANDLGGGFEAQMLIGAGLALSVPNALGGAIVGWIQGRSVAEAQKTDVHSEGYVKRI